MPLVAHFADQQLLTRAQAKVYADGFISVRLEEIGGGPAYAELSSKATAHFTNTVFAVQVQTIFQGTTVRAFLLNVYGFSIFGTIALISAFSCFVLAEILALLTTMGLLHYGQTEDSWVFPKPSWD